MLEEDFFATIKFKNGEEIFSKVLPSIEENKTILLLSNPITISEATSKRGNPMGYRSEPWLKRSSDDMFAINLCEVLTMCESKDVERSYIYQSYVRQKDSKKARGINMITKEMGYLSSVNDAKEILEKIFKNSTEQREL